MPISKRRKKKGKAVKRAQRLERAADKSSGVTLQELINVLAYQEYEKEGKLPSQTINRDPSPDFEAPKMALDNFEEENEDGR